MKLGRLLTFILSSAVSCCVCTPVQYSSAESAKYLLGDVDGDGKVSSVDASAVLAEYAAISGGNAPAFSEVQFRAADITRDGKTDSVDASQILSYYAYLSTGGTLIMEDFLAQPPVTTTAATSSATTTIVTTTTSVTTTVKKSEPSVKYGQSFDDITKSADAFNTFAEAMSLEIQRGSRIRLPDCNGEQYWMYGLSEARIALLLLNMDKEYDDGVLAEVFEGYTDYEIKNGILYLYRLPEIAELEDVMVNWHDYTDDYATAEYMNRLMESAKKGRETGDYAEYNDTLGFFLEETINNPAALLMTFGYGSRIDENDYNYIYNTTPEGLFRTYANHYPDEIKQMIH